MSLHAEPINDWSCPYPFRMFHIASEADAELGQYCLQFALFGVGLELIWVYDENTPLREKLAGMMADESWLDSASVTMSHADYKALREAEAIGNAYLRWYGAAKGYRDIVADVAHKAITTDAGKSEETDGAGA